MRNPQPIAIPINEPLLRGARRPRVALVGRPRAGKSTIFEAASSVAVHHARLAGEDSFYDECLVGLGLEEISLVDLPSICSLHRLRAADRIVLMYLLWGDQWPAIACHEPVQPLAAFAPPDVLVLVADATSLERDLELAFELSLLGRPMVIALNRMDEARDKGLFINVRLLSEKLGVPVVPTVAHMGKGIADLFRTALEAARSHCCPLPQPVSPHIAQRLHGLNALVARPDVEAAFCVPRPLLVTQLAENDDWFLQELAAHFPELQQEAVALREDAQRGLPRLLSDELHADRHHRAALLFEAVTGRAGPEEEGWRAVLDELFLHPRWGLIGSLAVFALVLFVVFEVSAVLDRLTAARLVEWAQDWQPDTTAGVIGRGVADGLIGLVGIVVPYMLPLVLLLVALEQSGIMHRVAFVVDRGFHRIGLHGGVAVPFLMGLGCNVPAISAAASATSGRDRVVAALLIAFVPCSARSAIILALGGKYLGGPGVFAVFVLTLVVIALVGRLLARRYAQAAPPGLIQEIPPYALPELRALARDTWERTRDIVTIVMPLLVGGSVVLALLNHWGADATINTLLVPITHWWLGLPAALGVPILFGVLRKELSLLMVFQALGTQDIAPLLDWVQIMTFLVFLTFYVPCISTFAVMLRAIGRREALFSVALSVGAALVIAGVVRAGMETVRLAL